MNLTFAKIPLETIAQAHSDGMLPSNAVRRTVGSERWHVVNSPVRSNPPTQFNLAKTERDVLIPVFEYRTRRAFEEALAFAIQLGIQLALQLTVPVSRLHVVMGDGYEYDEPRDELKLYLGFGFVERPHA